MLLFPFHYLFWILFHNIHIHSQSSFSSNRLVLSKSLANERDAAIDMLKRLDCGRYIVIMDRGYDGFNMIETCNRLPDCHYIIRTKAGYGLQILHGEYPLLIKELLFPLYVFLFLSLMDDTDRQFGLWNFFVFRFTI